MSDPAAGPPRRGIRAPLRGLLRLGLGRADGVRDFGEDRDAYLASLAPFVALTAVAALITALGGQPHQGLALLLRQISALLAPAVLAELFCRLWRRPWLRYATIVNWSNWLQLLVATVLYIVLRWAVVGAVPAGFAMAMTIGGILYLLAFQWFVARVALGISHGRVALLLTASLVVVTAISLQGVPLDAWRQAAGAASGS